MNIFLLPTLKEILMAISSKLNQTPQDLLHAAQRRYSHELDEPILHAIPVVSRPSLEDTLLKSAVFGVVCAVVAVVALPNMDIQSAFYVVWIPSMLCCTIFAASRFTYGFLAVTEMRYTLFALNGKSLDGGVFKESIWRPVKLPEPRTHKGTIIGSGPLPFEPAEKGILVLLCKRTRVCRCHQGFAWRRHSQPVAKIKLLGSNT